MLQREIDAGTAADIAKFEEQLAALPRRRRSTRTCSGSSA